MKLSRSSRIFSMLFTSSCLKSERISFFFHIFLIGEICILFHSWFLNRSWLGCLFGRFFDRRVSALRAARQFEKTVEVFGLLLVDTARPALDEVGEVGLARVEAARAIETGGGIGCFVGLEKLAAAVVLAFDHENWDCWDEFWLEINDGN